LDSTYLKVAKSKVLELINFRSPSYITERNKALREVGYQDDKFITKLSSISKFDCPFSVKDGLSCSMENSNLNLFEFAIAANGETYKMDFLDKMNHSIEEFPAYSGVNIPQQ
jgi:hypothetical protein